MILKNKKYKKTSPQQGPGFRWFVVISIIFCELMLYTWIRIESTQTILRTSREHTKLAKEISYYKQLSIEKDRLKSDERITRIAKTRLNLFPDTANQIIYLGRKINVKGFQ